MLRAGCTAVTFLMVSTGMARAQDCKPADVPNEATRVRWEPYLTRMFHDCFGHLDAEISKVAVMIRGQALIAVLGCPDLEFGCVVVSDEILQAKHDPGEIAFILGHEAGHIVLRNASIPLGSLEEEFAADRLSAESITHGGCLGARALEWVTSNWKKAVGPEGKEIEALWYRRVALLSQCGLGVLGVAR